MSNVYPDDGDALHLFPDDGEGSHVYPDDRETTHDYSPPPPCLGSAVGKFPLCLIQILVLVLI